MRNEDLRIKSKIQDITKQVSQKSLDQTHRQNGKDTNIERSKRLQTNCMRTKHWKLPTYRENHI